MLVAHLNMNITTTTTIFHCEWAQEIKLSNNFFDFPFLGHTYYVSQKFPQENVLFLFIFLQKKSSAHMECDYPWEEHLSDTNICLWQLETTL